VEIEENDSELKVLIPALEAMLLLSSSEITLECDNESSRVLLRDILMGN
jgi:hypothetical protein